MELSSPAQKISWLRFLLSIIGGLVLGSLLVVIALFSLDKFNILHWQNFVPSSFLSSQPSQLSENKAVSSQLPIIIDPKDPAIVTSSKNNMLLQGTIYSIRQQQNRWELILRGRGGNIFFDLPFYLTDKNNIVAKTKANFFSAPSPSDLKLAVTDLKAGQEILIYYYFTDNIKTGSITTLAVIK